MTDLVIERLGHRGEGIAPGPVYVARTLPGERVAGEVENGRIAAPKILSPSAERVSPPCPHFRTCGGCTLQHASETFVARWKADVVARALQAQGVHGEIAGVTTSPANARQRAVLSGRRTKGGALVGFHARASDTVIAIPDCRLLHPDIMSALPVLEALTARGASRKAEMQLAVFTSEAGLDVAASGAKAPDAALRAELAGIAQQGGLARLTWNGETLALIEPPRRRVGGVAVVPPPGAFLQATAHGEAALRDAVTRAVAGAGRIVDLFAGTGTFALPLARQAEVHAVEGDAALTEALAQAWRGASGLKAVTWETRDLFRRPLAAAELRGAEAAVIDPPRQGAEAQTRALAEAGVPVIAAVSCNPATFARDARILAEAGYALGPVTVVDQFRWSPHVELAAQFRRK